jgi:hypothetical protein
MRTILLAITQRKPAYKLNVHGLVILWWPSSNSQAVRSPEDLVYGDVGEQLRFVDPIYM